MLTKITQLPFEAAYASAIGAIDVDALLRERQILEDPGLKHWLRADVGFSSAGWRCRKTSLVAAPNRTAVPTQVLSGAIFEAANNNAGLLTGATNGTVGSLVLPGGLPLNSDYSIIWVGWTPASALHCTLWADDQETLNTNMRRVASTDDVDIRHEGALICGPVGAVLPSSPNVLIASYRKSDKRGKLIHNGVEIGTYRTDRGEILDGNLQLFSGGDLDTIVQPALNTVCNEVQVWTVPIDTDAARMTRVQDEYLLPRYVAA